MKLPGSEVSGVVEGGVNRLPDAGRDAAHVLDASIVDNEYACQDSDPQLAATTSGTALLSRANSILHGMREAAAQTAKSPQIP